MKTRQTIPDIALGFQANSIIDQRCDQLVAIHNQYDQQIQDQRQFRKLQIKLITKRFIRRIWNG